MRRVTLAVAVVMAVAAQAGAQTPPPKLWTEIHPVAPHATVAGIACGLAANAVVEGRTLPIALDALEDASQLCASSQTAPLVVRGRVKMTRAQPSSVVVEIDVPPGATARAQSELRLLLQNMAADIERRANAAQPLGAQAPAQPLVPWKPPPPVPMHPVKVPNTPMIAGGFGGFAAGYLVQLLVGLAIVGASGDPGTGRGWPFLPFVGLAIFSGSYQEASGCDCDAGRAFAMVGSVLVALIEVAGAVVGVAGLAVPRTKMVPDSKISIRLGPNGIEGTF